MATFQCEDQQETQHDLLPENSIHRCRLAEIKERSHTKADGKVLNFLTFYWKIEVPGHGVGPEAIGRTIRGECFAELNTRPDNKLRLWAEAILGREIPPGFALETSDLEGLVADVVVSHEADRKTAGKFWERADQVIAVEQQDDEIPF